MVFTKTKLVLVQDVVFFNEFADSIMIENIMCKIASRFLRRQ